MESPRHESSQYFWRGRAYPYTVDLYAITAGTENPHASALVDWFLTPAGQKLIDETGYVGLSPNAAID